jgi:hypothetical protein
MESLMFTGKARGLPKSGAPDDYYTRWFGALVNYGHKKICIIGPDALVTKKKFYNIDA